jgi:hypothetical protein
VIEFGVAGGSGLLSLEFHAEQISKELGIEIEVYGFDTAEGLPSSIDWRDLPYCWKKGFYRMDFEKLHKRLRFAKLVIGDVMDTAEWFFKDYHPAPVAAVLHDLDYYSSTAAALRIFNADDTFLLPRVFNYFDDIIGSNIELCGVLWVSVLPLKNSMLHMNYGSFVLHTILSAEKKAKRGIIRYLFSIYLGMNVTMTLLVPRINSYHLKINWRDDRKKAEVI